VRQAKARRFINRPTHTGDVYLTTMELPQSKHYEFANSLMGLVMFACGS